MISTFIARVDLHQVEEAVYYEKLHFEMAKEGFERTGSAYKSDTDYIKKGNHTVLAVRDAARKAAARVVDDFSILVTAIEVSKNGSVNRKLRIFHNRSFNLWA